MRLYIRHTIRFILLLLLQVLVLNNVHFGGFVNPYIYVLFVIMLPLQTPGWLLLITSFALGYSIDMFTNTPGMHTAATVFMAFCRPLLFKILLPKQEWDAGAYPSLLHLGFQTFLIYSLILVFVHHGALFFLEVFRFAETLLTLQRISLSVVATMLLIFIVQYLFYSKH